MKTTILRFITRSRRRALVCGATAGVAIALVQGWLSDLIGVDLFPTVLTLLFLALVHVARQAGREEGRDRDLADAWAGAPARIGKAMELHKPIEEEVEVWADGPGEDLHDQFLCSDDPAACLGHLTTILVCQECGYEHDGDSAIFRPWPCPTVKALRSAP
jgi:hypothetical protein